MNYIHLLEQVKIYIHDYLSDENQQKYCFHNIQHTLSVVAAAQELVDHYQLSDEDNFIVLCAAYFHDTGYACGGAKNHEWRGKNCAIQFLNEKHVEKITIDRIVNCILSTQMPQNPQNMLEMILCDADLFHLGGEHFSERNKLMHQEAEHVSGHKIDKATWRLMTISFLESHNYHTEYAKEKLSEGKARNLENLKKKQAKSAAKTTEERINKRPDRGIETMFRITASNSQRLSDMADNKANILLTVNSIILSLVVSVLLRSLDKNPHLIIPTIILMTVVVTVMVFAILSTIPKIPPGYFTEQQVEDKSVNLLFFGNFYKMPHDIYKESMDKAMEDSEFLYAMLTKDVYAQGVVLGRKYKLLRYGYGIFMFGLIISVLAFVFSIVLL